MYPCWHHWSWNDLFKKSWPNCRLVSKINVTALSNSFHFGVVCHLYIENCNNLHISTKPNIHSSVPQYSLTPGFNLPSGLIYDASSFMHALLNSILALEPYTLFHIAPSIVVLFHLCSSQSCLFFMVHNLGPAMHICCLVFFPYPRLLVWCQQPNFLLKKPPLLYTLSRGFR